MAEARAPTGYVPKELATFSRIEVYSGDPCQLFDVQEKIGEEDLRAPITLSEASYFQSQMHSDDSVESTADSDLEDGAVRKMLTSPLYAQKASGKPDAMVTHKTLKPIERKV